jgi:putative DNA primase/helicase
MRPVEDVPQCGDMSDKQTAAGPGGGLDLKLAKYPHTDLGNAERFRERNKDRLRWCPTLGWLWWDGKRWSRNGADAKVKAYEHETVRAIQLEAAALFNSAHDVPVGVKYRGKPDEQTIMMSDSLAQWGRDSESFSRLRPISDRAEAYLSIGPDELDGDPFKFNVANGTLAFRKTNDGSDYVTFGPHDPNDLMTKISPVKYDPKATCPTFDEFFQFVQPDEGQRRFLMQWHGLSLTGDISDQALCIFYGTGKNGKSTLVDLMAYIHGDYSETVPIETFLNQGRTRGAGQATPDLAMLPGVRHLRTSEPNRDARLDEALIKLVTGGERIIARHLNKDFFGFYPQFKLTISGNHRPKIGGTDVGIWRRPRLIPWTVIIPPDKVDRSLGIKLREEASGILNRLLDGLRDWLDNGLTPSDSIIAATKKYQDDSDPLGRFLEACIKREPGCRVQSSVMFDTFIAWARANGASDKWSNRGLTAALEERGFEKKHSDKMYWLDVKLIRVASDFVDADGKPLIDSAAGHGVTNDKPIDF